MEIETQRLVVRDYQEQDWQAVLAYQSDPRYLQYHPWTKRSAADVKSHLASIIAWGEDRPRHRFQFAIINRQDGELVGSCGLRQNSPDSIQGELGYELVPGCWGNGFAREAARAVLQFGFVEQQLHRIFAHCITENAASVRVLEKIGMRREGCLRENIWMKERWWDTFIYSMLDYEWESYVQEHQEITLSG